MARIRTFIAVNLADAVKRNLASLQEQLGRNAGNVKWTPVENMHLTLLFLGEVGQLEVVQICRTVQARARKHTRFILEAEGLGAFPNLRRPKILWGGLTGGVAELQSLHADLEEALLELGCYRREDRGYTPHLTLGRLSHDERAEDWARILAQHADWRGGTSPVNEVLVMSSDLHRDGPQYSVLGRAPLSQSEA
jgi:RNA 2',3'-cyclic 3'-phosphodiesterase